MANNRNQPCYCGSGLKYKKCCLNKLGGGPEAILNAKVETNILSDKLQESLAEECWYHGTDQEFDSWKFPPPPKPGQSELVPHSAVFFSTNIKFAKDAGTNLSRTKLSASSKILDATANTEASELLRVIVGRHPTASKTLNVDKRYWHNGWQDGSVLRIANPNEELSQYLDNMTRYYLLKGYTPDNAQFIVVQNLTRGFIELICESAKKMGFDALYGNEVDRHTEKGRVLTQPWLAVFSKDVMSKPNWL